MSRNQLLLGLLVMVVTMLSMNQSVYASDSDADGVDDSLDKCPNIRAFTDDGCKHGGSNDANTKPTYGISYETYNQYVTNGFSFGLAEEIPTSIDITDNFHTDFDKVEIETGVPYTFISKGYFAKGFNSHELCFGIPEAGKGYDAETCVEFHKDSDGIRTKLVQETPVINEHVIVSYAKVKCNDNDSGNFCDEITSTIVFDEPLKYDVMMMKGIDNHRQTTETYLNDGFDIDGIQFTELPSVMIPSPTKYEGLIKVTQSEKYSNVWTTNDGRDFERNSYGTFTWINQVHDSSMKERVSQIQFDVTRENAIKKFNSAMIQNFSNETPAKSLQQLVWN